MKKTLTALALLLTTTSFAHKSTQIPMEDRIGSITVEEIFPAKVKSASNGLNGGTQGGEIPPSPFPTEGPYPYPYPDYGQEKKDPIDIAGRVIGTAKDIVALGEDIYQLVQKGKPSSTTDYSAISVVPINPETQEIVDPFDLEGFSMPEERNFVTRIKNGAGKEVIRFEYKVLYSYGGSFSGKGKYLTGVMIVPSSVKTSWGWDFSASMRLQSIMNHGTRENPVAGALLTIKYNMNSWSAAFERNDTIHVTGKGQLKNYAK